MWLFRIWCPLRPSMPEYDRGVWISSTWVRSTGRLLRKDLPPQPLTPGELEVIMAELLYSCLHMLIQRLAQNCRPLVGNQQVGTQGLPMHHAASQPEEPQAENSCAGPPSSPVPRVQVQNGLVPPRPACRSWSGSTMHRLLLIALLTPTSIQEPGACDPEEKVSNDQNCTQRLREVA